MLNLVEHSTIFILSKIGFFLEMEILHWRMLVHKSSEDILHVQYDTRRYLGHLKIHTIVTNAWTGNIDFLFVCGG